MECIIPPKANSEASPRLRSLVDDYQPSGLTRRTLGHPGLASKASPSQNLRPGTGRDSSRQPAQRKLSFNSLIGIIKSIIKQQQALVNISTGERMEQAFQTSYLDIVMRTAQCSKELCIFTALQKQGFLSASPTFRSHGWFARGQRQPQCHCELAPAKNKALLMARETVQVPIHIAAAAFLKLLQFRGFRVQVLPLHPVYFTGQQSLAVNSRQSAIGSTAGHNTRSCQSSHYGEFKSELHQFFLPNLNVCTQDKLGADDIQMEINYKMRL